MEDVDGLLGLGILIQRAARHAPSGADWGLGAANRFGAWQMVRQEGPNAGIYRFNLLPEGVDAGGEMGQAVPHIGRLLGPSERCVQRGQLRSERNHRG